MLYTIKQVDDFLSTIDKTQLVREQKRYVYNLACSFDIETSSFYQADNVIYTNAEYRKALPKNAIKKAIMYIWQFAVEDNVIIGRTWNDFLYLIRKLKVYLELENRFLVVYVHNLAYEFQFICKWFQWVDIFADSERKPMKATTTDNIIFKCSYRLSGYSLDTLAKNLQSHKIKKLVGDLDYNLIRNAKTSLTDKELEYCINDVLIVTAYINEQILEYGTIEKIPLTQTGKVRRFVRQKCFSNKKYKFLIEKLTIEPLEYKMLKNAFAGGFTHCNAMYTEIVCTNVTSFDFTSSYPTVLIAEKYPMSKGQKVYVETVEQLKTLINQYACLIDVRLSGVKSKFLYDNIISVSKCRHLINPRINNGRLVSADDLYISITDVDFLNIETFYSWDKIEIGVVYIYERGYLPKEIIETILKLYKDKTELKGVDGKEQEYLHSKELINSVYGMCVTSIIHDVYNFDGKQWTTTPATLESELNEYNTDKNRFLFYQWGVWCTAYARNNLYTGILECKQDYIYSDTDSIKILNAENHKQYFERYNKWIVSKLQKCLDFYGLDKDLISPRTNKNEIKTLGIWDFDGFYTRFKTLGAKRYIVEKDNKLNITVCGLSKKSGMEYIKSQNDPFKYFNCGMYIDREHTGKMIHTYIDNEIEGVLTDYQGNESYYNEKSYIHLENTDYLLSLTNMYIEYYKGIQKLFIKGV